ncbi:MAG: hypothetical protein ACOCT0_03745 [Halobacteriota archaeon]
MDLDVREAGEDDLPAIRRLVSDSPGPIDRTPDDVLDGEDVYVAVEASEVVGALRSGPYDGAFALHSDDVEAAAALAKKAVDVGVVRTVAAEGSAEAEALDDAFERAGAVRVSRGFGFPYGSSLDDAGHDATLEFLRETGAYSDVGGVYLDVDLWPRPAPGSPDDVEGAMLGYRRDGVQGVAVVSGGRSNPSAPVDRAELVVGFLWADEAYVAEVGLDLRGLAHERGFDDVFVAAPPEYDVALESAGYDLGVKGYVYEKPP